MFDPNMKLSARCHINKNGDGDRFVGIKADSDNAMVYFPMGYELPKDEDTVRQDIMQLIAVLSEFNEKTDHLLHMSSFEAPQSVNFPINAYMTIIRYYLNHGYYTEKESVIKLGDHGHIDYKASIRHVTFYQEDGSPFFEKYAVRGTMPNEKNLITMIHKYCVYHCFKQLGWLFTPHLPADPHIKENHDQFIYVLRRKLADTNDDQKKMLFNSMIAFIEHFDDPTHDKRFYFGTDRFEYVWEKMIDSIFGIRGKEEYFPRTRWSLKYGDQKNNYALEPDSIMIHNDRIYVLDAKYYRYGVTGKPKDLPESTSINKQITYGEYIYEQKRFREKYGDNVPVYNAFLMPYNKDDNPFGTSDVFANVGEATSDWKHNSIPYQRVQGIVIDTRYLIYNYRGSQTRKILKMAETIDRALRENGGELLEENTQS